MYNLSRHRQKAGVDEGRSTIRGGGIMTTSLKKWVEEYFNENPTDEFEYACIQANYDFSDKERPLLTFNDLNSFYENEEVQKEFDSGYGGTESAYFTIWTKNSVLFPVCYDGAEWLEFVPRSPCDIAKEHAGGG
jgi:hypothetical protein